MDKADGQTKLVIEYMVSDEGNIHLNILKPNSEDFSNFKVIVYPL